MKKRALRRFHNERLKRKAKKYAHEIFGVKTESGIFYYIKNFNNLTICSCDMCRNQRRSNLFKGKSKLTTKEFLNLYYFKNFEKEN